LKDTSIVIFEAVATVKCQSLQEESMNDKKMSEAEIKKAAEEGTLSADMDTASVLEGAEPWEPIETKLVLWSFAAAGVALIIGLIFVPTSIFH